MSITGHYFDLLYAVERKFPGETRHQTALRYIQEAERRAAITSSDTKQTQTENQTIERTNNHGNHIV